MNKIACDICGSHIAQADLDSLKLPLSNTMFKSLMPDNGVPDPFPLDGWLSFRCPFCHYRPFHKEDTVKIVKEGGALEEFKIGEEFKCECGATYKHKQSLIRHKKDCKWPN